MNIKLILILIIGIILLYIINTDLLTEGFCTKKHQDCKNCWGDLKQQKGKADCNNLVINYYKDIYSDQCIYTKKDINKGLITDPVTDKDAKGSNVKFKKVVCLNTSKNTNADCTVISRSSICKDFVDGAHEDLSQPANRSKPGSLGNISTYTDCHKLGGKSQPGCNLTYNLNGLKSYLELGYSCGIGAEGKKVSPTKLNSLDQLMEINQILYQHHNITWNIFVFDLDFENVFD